MGWKRQTNMRVSMTKTYRIAVKLKVAGRMTKAKDEKKNISARLKKKKNRVGVFFFFFFLKFEKREKKRSTQGTPRRRRDNR